MTLVGACAHDGIRARAGAGLAGVGLRAGVAVVTGRAVGLDGIAAGARRGVAGAGRMALVGGRAHDRVRAHAGTGLAGVGLRAVIAIVTESADGLGGYAAGCRRGIARTSRMALVGGRAHDLVLADAGTGLTGVAPLADVLPVSGRAVGLGGVAAGARRGIAGAGRVTLVGGRAHDRVRARAGTGLAGVGLRAVI